MLLSLRNNWHLGLRFPDGHKVHKLREKIEYSSMNILWDLQGKDLYNREINYQHRMMSPSDRNCFLTYISPMRILSVPDRFFSGHPGRPGPPPGIRSHRLSIRRQ